MMKSIKNGALRILGTALSALALAACGSNGAGGEGPPPATTYKSFVFIANCGSDSISAFSIDSETGALTAAGEVSLPSFTAPRSIAIGPAGKFAYVVGSGNQMVYAYSVNTATGALTAVPGSPYPITALPRQVAVDPSGRFAYAVSYDRQNVSAFFIDARTGSLSTVAGSPFGAPGGPLMIVIEPSGKFAYALNYDTESVSTFSVNGTTGALTRLSIMPIGVGTAPQSMAIDPSGQFAYIANEGTENISAFSIDKASGALTPVPGSPFAPAPLAMHFPEAIAVDPLGRFVYVISGTGSFLSFSINGVTGALAPTMASSSYWDSPYAIAFENQGKYAYVVYWRPTSYVTVQSYDPDSGAMFTDSMWTVGNYASAVAVSRIAQ